MPSSTASFLEPLSSPSPSPPPPEEHSPEPAGAAGLDSGSELSELTEDEQEDNREVGTKGAEARDGKRKRSDLNPAPMWDWAYKPNKKSDWRTGLVEEEEEEEQSGPARPMEEEEDDDQERRADGEGRVKRRLYSDDNEGEGEGEDEREANEDNDDPHASASEDEMSTPLRLRRAVDDVESEDEEGDEGDVEADADGGQDAAASAPSQPQSPKGGRSPELSDDENGDDENGDEEEVDEDAADDEPTAPESDVDDDVGAPTAVEPTTLVDSALPALNVNASLMDIDNAPPSSLLGAPAPLAGAGSSIMAGSTVVDPPSLSSSSSSSSGSPSSSRSGSPEPEPIASHREPEPESKASSSRSSGNQKKTKTRPSRRPRRNPEADHDAAGDGDGEQAPGMDADQDEGDVVEADDLEAESPEQELESDLQPAHRAEALDVLATIELKFALLRERLYVEKMDSLAWEEALVADGTHPEMLHLHSELLKRRDKRLELASRRRDYESANVTKRRRLDEDAVWSWWKNERDDLQTEMISETNRKRRRLERERRALERPQPEHRIPVAPQVVDAPLSLREIVNSYPYGLGSHGQSSRQKARVSSTNLAYPHLSTLSPLDVARDLEFLFQHRRAAGAFEHPRSIMINPGVGGPAVGQAYDYPINFTMLDGPGAGNRFGPLPPNFSHQHPQHFPQMQGPPVMQGFPAQGPRLAHHYSAPVGSLPNVHPMDQDILRSHRPDSRSAHSAPHVQQYAAMGPMTGPSNLMRRSISPVPVQALSNGTGPGISIGMGQPPMPPGFAGPKPNGWAGVNQASGSLLPGGAKESRRPNSVMDAREREEERERQQDGFRSLSRSERDLGDRDRDREEREELHIQNVPMQQRLVTHQHPHTHVHAAPGGQVLHHHLGSHHHHHHHHHVHHHHHPQQSNGPGVAPPMSALPPSVSSSTSATLSPRAARDVELRRPRSGAPSDTVEMVSGPSRQPGSSSHTPTLWKGHDESPLPPADGSRERGRPPLGPPVGPHERLMTPFTMGPAPSMQASYSSSPRHNGQAIPTAPLSAAQSRRGSWSAPEENGVPRPASSASQGHSASGHSQTSAHRHPSMRRPHTPNVPLASGSTWGSPPHKAPNKFGMPPTSPRSNGMPLRPKSPSSVISSPFPGIMRSPHRISQSSLNLQLPPPPPLKPAGHSSPGRAVTPPKTGSPSLKAIGRTPASPGQSKGPASRSAGLYTLEQQPSSSSAISIPASAEHPINVVNFRTTPPLPYSSIPNHPHPHRPSNAGMSEAPISGGPVVNKVVPVDGS